MTHATLFAFHPMWYDRCRGSCHLYEYRSTAPADEDSGSIDIRRMPAGNAGKEVVMSENQVFCPNCGTPNNAGAKFCANCGAPLPAAGPARMNAGQAAGSYGQQSGQGYQQGASAPQPQYYGQYKAGMTGTAGRTFTVGTLGTLDATRITVLVFAVILSILALFMPVKVSEQARNLVGFSSALTGSDTSLPSSVNLFSAHKIADVVQAYDDDSSTELTVCFRFLPALGIIATIAFLLLLIWKVLQGTRHMGLWGLLMHIGLGIAYTAQVGIPYEMDSLGIISDSDATSAAYRVVFLMIFNFAFLVTAIVCSIKANRRG